mmetsp:Transcript_9172/g.21022  ORF Transcript_9172/g.21022 Transcript_9172/m.21022 type:complete len:319 (-) Transcript_9172:1089-2045(-)
MDVAWCSEGPEKMEAFETEPTESDRTGAPARIGGIERMAEDIEPIESALSGPARRRCGNDMTEILLEQLESSPAIGVSLKSCLKTSEPQLMLRLYDPFLGEAADAVDDFIMLLVLLRLRRAREGSSLGKSPIKEEASGEPSLLAVRRSGLSSSENMAVSSSGCLFGLSRKTLLSSKPPFMSMATELFDSDRTNSSAGEVAMCSSLSSCLPFNPALISRFSSRSSWVFGRELGRKMSSLFEGKTIPELVRDSLARDPADSISLVSDPVLPSSSMLSVDIRNESYLVYDELSRLKLNCLLLNIFSRMPILKGETHPASPS